MSSSAFELWRPQQTGWVDQSAGIARIQRSRNLSSLDAKRIAKIILHEKGAAELACLWSWVQAELRSPGAYPGLPPLGLPFHRFIDLQAKWVPLTPQPGTGVPRRLATRIVGFRSDEPYLRLLEGSDNDNRQAPPAPEGGKPRGWGRLPSKFRPDVPVSITDAKPDAELDELVILGAGIRDFAAEGRPTELVAKELTITEPSDSGRRRLGKDVDSSSLGGPAERGTGAAPAILGADEHVFSMGDVLLVQSKWIRLTLQQLAKECAVAVIPFAATWLPGPDATYAFRWPANNTNYARKRSISRCFLVAQITLGGRICYLVDPERRVPSDTFPIGVIRGKHDPVLQFEDLDTLAEHFEMAHRKGTGWLADGALPDHVVGLAIRRSALETEPERTRFSERSAKTVIELIEGKSHLPR